jgi:hypothetical protein
MANLFWEALDVFLMFSCCLLHKKWVLFLISPFLIWYASSDRKGFGNLMFPCGCALLGVSFDVGPSILFFVFPPFLWVLLFNYDWQGFIIILVCLFYRRNIWLQYHHMGQSLWLPNWNNFIFFGKPWTLCLKPNLVSEYLILELHQITISRPLYCYQWHCS